MIMTATKYLFQWFTEPLEKIPKTNFSWSGNVDHMPSIHVRVRVMTSKLYSKFIFVMKMMNQLELFLLLDLFIK
jgi:hypothetical protein